MISPSRLTIRLLLAVPALLAPGCMSSKWAMDDPVYREKYDRPYEPGEKLPRMAKQIVDARHVEGRGGLYVGSSVASDPTAVGGELGLFMYPYSWAEGRLAVAALGGVDTGRLFTGLDAGLRIQPPSRLAPFAGIGVFTGWTEFDVPADHDGLDNDDDYFVDERGETETEHAAISAVYPELGIHFWCTSHVRLTTSASYYVTTEGRDRDFWFLGTSLSFLGGE